MKKNEGILSTPSISPGVYSFGCEFTRSVASDISLSKSFIVGKYLSGILPTDAGQIILMGVRLLDDCKCTQQSVCCFTP